MADVRSFASDGPGQAAEWIRGPAADLFSSYVAAAALSAAHELGLLDELARVGVAHLDPGGPADLQVMRSLAAALQWAEIAEVADDGKKLVPGPAFADAHAARGYIYWLVRGCGQLFTSAPVLALREARTGQFWDRDMRAVAQASRLIGDGEVEPLFDDLLARLGVARVADLGCGSGQRLIRIAARDRDVTCVGIDVSADSVRLASQNVARHGLADRVRIKLGDVRQLEAQPELADVDMVTCVFMGHDFWPREDCVTTLRGLRRAFPAARRLLLCDVTRTTEPAGPRTPIFTLGFELAHALMGVPLPTLDDWKAAVELGGWACEAIHPVTAPPNGFLLELSPAR